MNVTSTTITGTQAEDGGGGAVSQSMNAHFIGVMLVIQNSRAGHNGGAIYQQGRSIMNVTSTTITNTTTQTGEGGAVCQYNSAGFFGVTLVIQNSMADNGGAIYQGDKPS
eukprot:PhF_6_TR25824/c1_g1_i4/m.36467